MSFLIWFYRRVCEKKQQEIKFEKVSWVRLQNFDYYVENCGYLNRYLELLAVG